MWALDWLPLGTVASELDKKCIEGALWHERAKQVHIWHCICVHFVRLKWAQFAVKSAALAQIVCGESFESVRTVREKCSPAD